MTVIYTNWTQGAKQPQTHARMLHQDKMRDGGTVNLSSTETGYFGEAPDGPETFERWKPGQDTGFWGKVWGGDRFIDSVAIAGHDLGSTGSSIRIDTTANGVDWDVAEQPLTAITNDSPILWLFQGVTVRGIRVWLSSGADRPSIGVIRFGEVTEFEQPMFSGVMPSRYSRTTTFDTTYSQSGKILARDVERSNLSGSVPLQHMTPEWVDSDWHEAVLALEKGPFFLAWRPDGTKTTSLYDDVIYGMATETPKVTPMGVRDYLESSINYTAEAYE